MGCRKSVSSGISWFFDQEEMGIILEDDCLPSESFFNYCKSFLTDTKMMKGFIQSQGLINKMNGRQRMQIIFFQVSGNCWGWSFMAKMLERL